MSSEQDGSPEAATQQPAQPQSPSQKVSPEFIERLNQFIRMANRLERHRDSQYATFVFMNAFARYAGHHYLSKVKKDSPEERQAFVQYISNSVGEMVMQNIGQISDYVRQVAVQRQAAQAQGETGATDAPGA